MIVCDCGRRFKPLVPGKIICVCGKVWHSDLEEIKRAPILLDIDEGRRHWDLLHKYALLNKSNWSIEEAEKFFTQWELDIPNISCGCRKNWFELRKTLFFDNKFDTPENFFAWSVHAHNAVNTKLNKPIVSYEEACKIHGF